MSVRIGPGKAGRQSQPIDRWPLTLPEVEPAEWGIVALLFVLATGYRLLFRRLVTMGYDEGITLQGAERILSGQVMYRDFFSLVTPGSCYFFASLFKIFGNSMVVARTVVALYGGLFTAFTYLLARRVCQRWSAILTAYIITVTVLPNGFWVLHNWDSTFWACASLYCAVWFLHRPNWGWALTAGTCVSVTVLFEQSKGAGLLLGMAVGFVILHSCGEIRLKYREIIATFAGLTWPIAVTVAYFAARHSLPQMMADLLWPFQHYSGVNSVPYGFYEGGPAIRSAMLAGSWLYAVFLLLTVSPYFLVPALPIFGLGILVYFIMNARSRTGQAQPHRWSYYILICACSTGMLLALLASKRDSIHLMEIAPIFCLVLAWFVDATDIRLRILDPIRPALVLLLAFVFTLNGIAMLASNANSRVYIDTRRGMVRVSDQESALGTLLAHTKPGEDIFVYPWCPLYYYLTATLNPTPFEFLVPGFNTSEQLKETVRQISGRRPRIVLFQSSFYENIFRGFPSTQIRVLAARDPVTDYIFEEYRPCLVLMSAQSDRFLYMIRKDQVCPGKPSTKTSGEAVAP